MIGSPISQPENVSRQETLPVRKKGGFLSLEKSNPHCTISGATRLQIIPLNSTSQA
jgi:hypothetical protein